MKVCRTVVAVFGHQVLLRLISATLGDPSEVSLSIRNPPPLVRKRLIAYLTVNLAQHLLWSFLLPPCWRRFSAILQQEL